jgi:hypothetical protein
MMNCFQHLLFKINLRRYITCMLFPLSVIKTRQMVGGGGANSPGGITIVRDIIKEGGVLGLYRGFGTIVVGTLPIRMVGLGGYCSPCHPTLSDASSIEVGAPL